MRQVILNRVLWSPSASQCLTGYDQDGEFVHTHRVFATCKEDVYTTADGSVEYIVQSWAPDGRGYNDKGKK